MYSACDSSCAALDFWSCTNHLMPLSEAWKSRSPFIVIGCKSTIFNISHFEVIDLERHANDFHNHSVTCTVQVVQSGRSIQSDFCSDFFLQKLQLSSPSFLSFQVVFNLLCVMLCGWLLCSSWNEVGDFGVAAPLGLDPHARPHLPKASVPWCDALSSGPGAHQHRW